MTFVAGAPRRSVGVKPACTEAREGIPPGPLGSGVLSVVVVVVHGVSGVWEEDEKRSPSQIFE